jgi:hypothetical protein
MALLQNLLLVALFFGVGSFIHLLHSRQNKKGEKKLPGPVGMLYRVFVRNVS